MKTIKYIYSKITLFLVLILLVTTGCERELSDDVVEATFSSTAEIFTDTPVGMGTDFYFPYIGEPSNPLGSKLTAWSIDTDISYQGSASMRFDVPNAADPEGNFAGALFKIDGAGRNLTKYNVLTFWARASQGCSIAEIGFGEGDFATKLENVNLSTQWTKYFIPIPDPSKFLQERGMLFYSAGSINGFGYTFWIDELKFESISTLGVAVPYIQNGNNENSSVFVGDNSLSISGIGATYKLPNGFDQKVNINSSFFDFNSSDASVAATTGSNISIVGSGAAVLTGSLNGKDAAGSLNISSVDLAPTPTLPQANVISIFSDAYTNNPVDYFNGYWGFSTTQGQDDIDVNGNKMIKYTELNFVGTEFQGTPIDISSMTHFHIDILVDEPIDSGDFIRIQLDNLAGRKGAFTINLNSTPALKNGGWISLDLPFSSFGLNPNTTDLKQLVYVSDATVKTIYVDNIYFHN
ncbi:MAG: glycosyl hydrolase family 16 [Polaribacter sp.]